MKNKKINIIRIILIILLFITFARIFSFSNQNGVQSSGVSRKVTKILTNNIKKVQAMSKEEKEIFMNNAEKIIRKLAHFSIYTVVGFLMMALMSTYNAKTIIRVSISFGIGVIYAISDEIHQYFIPGRSGRVFDVIIDSFGVLTGICIIMIILYIITKIKKKIRISE